MTCRRVAGLLACLCALLLATLPASGCRGREWQDASPLLEQQMRSGGTRPWWIEQTPAEPGVAWYGVGSAPFYDPVAMVQAPLVAESRARMALAKRLQPVLADAALVLLVHGETEIVERESSTAEQSRIIAEQIATVVARDAAVVEMWQDREERTIHTLVRALDSHVLFRLLTEIRERWLAAALEERAEDEDDVDDEDVDDDAAPRLRVGQAMALMAQMPATPVRVTLTSAQAERGARAWMPADRLWADPIAWPARHEPSPAESGILAGALVYTARNELALERAEEAARLRLAIRSALVVQEAIARLFERQTHDPRRRYGAGVVLDVAAAVGLEAAERAQVRSLILEPPGPMPELGNPRMSVRQRGRDRGGEPDPAWSKLGLDANQTASAWYTPLALRTRANRAMVGVNLQALAYFTARGLEQRLSPDVLPERRDMIHALRRYIEEARREVLADDRPTSPLRSPIDTPLDPAPPLLPLPPNGDNDATPHSRDAPPPTLGNNTQEPESATTIHVVQAGESLAQIAHQHYGKPCHWHHIAKANNLYTLDIKSIQPGTKLTIPPLQSDDDADTE